MHQNCEVFSAPTPLVLLGENQEWLLVDNLTEERVVVEDSSGVDRGGA